MKYADNNRISHRQVYRQIVLCMTAPFLLCGVGFRGLLGAEGVVGILLALPLLSLYVIFLIRLAHVYENPERYLGKAGQIGMGLFFLSYVVLTGAFLLSVLGEIVPRYLVTGVDGRLLELLAVLVCGLGTFHGMQKRGRMAEMAGGVAVGGVVILYLLSVSQGELSHFPQLMVQSGALPLSGRAVWRHCYTVLCLFSGIGLLPLLLSKVEKASAAAYPVQRAIWMLGLLLGSGLILLQAAFGIARVEKEAYPVLPLMAGANLPGDVLGRFDVIWMGLLLFGLLFAVGSLQYYGTHILGSVHLEGGRWGIAALMLLFCWVWLPGENLQAQYPWMLQWIFCPGFVLVSFLAWCCRKRNQVGGQRPGKGEEE